MCDQQQKKEDRVREKQSVLDTKINLINFVQFKKNGSSQSLR